MPALHHHPRQAIPQLEAAIAELGRPLLVGSSLGGYYATHLAERHGLKALLVNPAVSPHRMFDGYLGTQKNLYTDETWELTHDHVTALAELEVAAPMRQRLTMWCAGALRVALKCWACRRWARWQWGKRRTLRFTGWTTRAISACMTRRLAR